MYKILAFYCLKQDCCLESCHLILFDFLIFLTFLFMSDPDQNPNPECIPVPVPLKQKVPVPSAGCTTLILAPCCISAVLGRCNSGKDARVRGEFQVVVNEAFVVLSDMSVQQRRQLCVCFLFNFTAVQSLGWNCSLMWAVQCVQFAKCIPWRIKFNLT